MNLTKALLVVGLLSGAAFPLHADTLQWNVPNLGLINLNLSTTQTLIGYDAVLKQSIAGASLPIYTDPHNIVTLQVGADAPWQSNGATVEPLVLMGHNLMKEIPMLAQFPNAAVNVFARWSTEQGKAGVGVAFSYAFGGVATPTPSPAPVAP